MSFSVPGRQDTFNVGSPLAICGVLVSDSPVLFSPRLLVEKEAGHESIARCPTAYLDVIRARKGIFVD